ncbi:hypothetical Protein pso3_02870 [Candidatus Phytoplasma solani]
MKFYIYIKTICDFFGFVFRQSEARKEDKLVFFVLRSNSLILSVIK